MAFEVPHQRVQPPYPVLDEDGELDEGGPGPGPTSQFLHSLASTGVFASSIRSTG
jgi:hypothetical protein